MRLDLNRMDFPPISSISRTDPSQLPSSRAVCRPLIVLMTLTRAKVEVRIAANVPKNAESGLGESMFYFLFTRVMVFPSEDY